MKVRYTRNALQDMYRAEEYTAVTFGKQQVRVLLTELKSSEDQIAHFPQSGFAGRKKGTREMLVRNMPFVFVYRIHIAHIEVLACLHQSRQWPT